MINESKLNNRMFHLMESGFFGKQLLNEQEVVKQGGIGDIYQYKRVQNADDSVKYFYANKGATNWTEQKYPKGISEIQRIYFPDDYKGSAETKPETNGQEVIKQGGYGDPYQYKRVQNADDSVKYFYANKGATNWTEQKYPKGISEIQRIYFPDDYKGSTGAKPDAGGSGSGAKKKEPTLSKRVNIYNETDKDIDCAYAYKNTHLGTNEKSFTSIGWIKIKAMSDSYINFPDIKEIFIYAEGFKEGTYSFCVDSSKNFKFENANEKCSNIKKFHLLKETYVEFFTNKEGGLDIALEFYKSPRGKEPGKERAFAYELQDIAKDSTYKVGKFVVTNGGISFYDINFLGQSIFIDEVKNPPPLRFWETASALGFSKEGLWLFDSKEKYMYFYNKSKKDHTPSTLNNSNSVKIDLL